MYKRIKELREMHSLSQNECAKRAYISLNSFIRYEKGERMIPLDVAKKLAELFDVSIDYIAEYTDEEKPYKKKEIRK